jgi:hypothetical protein
VVISTRPVVGAMNVTPTSGDPAVYAVEVMLLIWVVSNTVTDGV